MNDIWYKHAVIYGVDVETYKDGNGDGVGDFKGLCEELDYISSLGVTCIWLLPFYPSSNRDNGYDVTNYIDVDPRYGTLEDFRAFVKKAENLGIRVIIDLVIHHTSIDHPWFQASRVDETAKFRDYYIWTSRMSKKKQKENIFPGVEDGVWQYDHEAKAYYHHLFYHFEPDLNVANPLVQEEIYHVIEFWLTMGIAGFRMDAASHLFEKKGKRGTQIKTPGRFLRELHHFIEERRSDAVLLAETDVKPEQIELYFGKGSRVHLLFNFLLNNNIFLAFARNSASPLVKGLQELPNTPTEGQWANFLRNLDELDLERLSEEERKEVYNAFAPAENMRIYDRGIRRRLAPMLGGDPKRLKMAFTLLFSLPGSPLFVYGDEIGMGDDLSLPERVSVRTPMQWSEKKHAGFSAAKEVVRNVISDGPFSYEAVNVAKQKNDSDSLLNFIKRLIALWKRLPEIGSGSYKVLDVGNPAILAIRYLWKGSAMVTLVNFSEKPVKAMLEPYSHDRLKELFADDSYTIGKTLDLNPYGFRWFRLKKRRRRKKL